MHEGDLLSLLPPYFSLMSQTHEKDGCCYTCSFGVRAEFLWLCVCVWHTVMFVKCNKPHRVDHNCKMLHAFQFPISSGQLYRLGTTGKLLYGKYEDAKTRWRSLMWALKKSMSHYYSFWTLACYLLFFFFSPLLFPSLVSVSFSVRGVNWLREAKAGGQAEGWSIKLVNHFLFSLRTAVDWWERPLCPPSQPASKFAASPFQCMTACCGERRRKKGGCDIF